MGVGKTSLGRVLAESLTFDFIDIDQQIVEQENSPIPDIFKKQGEPYFRVLESKTIEEALQATDVVISTGGGAVMTPQTADLIWEKAVSIWIHSDIDILLKRVSGDLTRPLLHHKDPCAVLKKLEQERSPVYKKADIHIQSGDESLAETLKNIKEKLNEYTHS